MAKSGLSLDNPLYGASGAVPAGFANPYTGFNPAASSGASALQQGLADIAVMGQATRAQLQPQALQPAPAQSAEVLFSPSARRFYINGVEIDENDDAGILRSEALLSQPSVGAPQGGDWIPVAPETYRGFVESIKRPTLGTQLSKGFETGVQQLKQMGGSALQLAGAEQLGGRLVESAEQRLQQLSPYQRQFTDIEVGSADRGVIDWFVANLGQQGPMLLESIAAGLAGAAAGSVAAGPGLGTAGGFLAGVFGKKAFKDKVLGAAAKYRTAGREALTPDELGLLKNASALAGATAATFASGQVIGAGDIYGEMREQGVGPEDFGARMTALAGSFPYALAESMAEFLLAGRVLGGVGAPRARLTDTTTTRVTPGGTTTITTGPTRTQRGLELLRRGAVGGGVGALAEGGTELFQEGLVMGLSGQDLTSDEAVKRFINSFAAGAAIGGPIGGIANLKSRKPDGTEAPAAKEEVNLLAPPPPTAPIPTSAQIPLPLAGGEAVSGPTEFAPGPQPGAQGVLDIGVPGAALSPQEAALRGQVQPEQPPAAAPQQLDMFAPEAQAPAQGVLQFAPAAPSGIGFTEQQPVPNTLMAQQIQAAQRRQQEDLARQQRAQQEAAIREQQLDIMANRAAAQRQLDIAAAQAQPPAPLPMRPSGPTQPTQLPLFTRRQAPVPSRAEGLRRGVGAQLPVPPVAPTVTPAQRRAQMPLFTREGEPSVAALRAAGVRTKLPPVPPKAPATKPRTQRGLKRQAGVAAVEIVPKEAPRAVQKPSPAPVPAQPAAKARPEVGEKVPAKREAPRKSETLKVKKPAEAKKPLKKEAPAPKAAPAPAVVETETAAEKWDNERLPGDIAYIDLPQSAKDEWDASDRSGAAQIVLLERLAEGKLPMTDTERFNYNIALADEAIKVGNDRTLKEAMLGGVDMTGGIIETAFFTPRGPNTNARIDEARAYLTDTDFTDAQRETMLDAFVLQAQGRSLDAYTKGGKDKGAVAPWFAMALNSPGMVRRLSKANVVFQGIPAEQAQSLLDSGQLTDANLPEATLAALGRTQTPPAQAAGKTPQRSPAVALADKIDSINKSTAKTNAAQQAKNTADLSALWKQSREADLDLSLTDSRLGRPIADFFTKDGTPITNVVDGRQRVGTKKLTKAEITKLEETAREERRLQREAREAGEIPTLEQWDDDVDSGRYFTADGKPIRAAMVVGRVRMAVSKFLSRLRVKPKVGIYKNQADLKTKNPTLYQRAAAARTAGDFDTANAAGYSFGDGQVILFTDRIATIDHLNFILAHETLGHFGLRGIIPANQFNALMESIYDQSQTVRDAADAASMTRGIPKAEAVEEYLADFAAELDVSLVARIFNAIKNALNKLGVKFADDAARFWVSQARKYVRNGERPSLFVTSDVMRRLNDIEGGLDPDNTGRYALSGTLRGDNMAADLMSDTTGGMPESLAEAGKRVRDFVGDSFDSADKFKSRFFSLFNFRARQNPGLAELDRILRAGRGFAMSMKNAANEKMAVVLNRAVASSVAGWAGVGGITTAQTTQLNKMLYDAQRYAVSKLTPADIGKTPLFTVAADGTVVPNDPEIKRVYELGRITFEQARDGFNYEVTYMDAGKEVTETVNIPGIADLDKKGPVWQGYLRTRETLRDVELQLLRARYAAYTQERDLAFREIGDLTQTKKLTANDQRFLERMYRKYRDLWTADQTTDEDGNPAYSPAAMEKANDFLVKFNAALIGKGTDLNADVAAFFEGAAADDVVKSLDEFKSRLLLSEGNEFAIQNRIKDIIVAEVSNDGADSYTKTTLATGYVPILREGGFQVRVLATNRAGKPARLKQGYKEQLVFSQVETSSDAQNLANKINDLFGDKTYQVEAYNEDTRQYELMDVRLNAVPETAITEIAAPPDLNLNEFVRGLRQFSITLPPAKLKEVIVALTRQNSSARNRLKREFTPGASPDAIKALTQHIESRASVSAKVLMRPKINELMNLSMSSTQKLWNGDETKMNQLKLNYDRAMADPAATEAERVEAKRAYDVYRFQYQNTNPPGEAARGNQYYNEAASALSFLDNNRSVEESDFGAGKVASNVRAYTSMLQLGASIATGALNYIGSITNGIPFLATYNDKTAFGGGFGFASSIAEFRRALSQVGLIRSLPGVGERGLNTAEFYDTIARNEAMQRQYRLTEAEARFMATEIREGEMIPALSNALVSSARGRVTVGAGQKAIDSWMWTFNVTEQAARRGLGLAAYRLQYARGRGAGMTEADAAVAARDFAVNTLRFTVGDYSVMNRPPAWRSGIQSFIYMYKVFPTTSIQLLSRLPREGQLYMLGALWVLGGVAAFPFAEDLEDLIDSIAQGLGLRVGSVRAELAKAVDAVVPGASPYFIRGFANAYFPGNIADRVSLSNFIPGTGILLAGADVGKELTDIAGPAASMLTGVATTIPRILQAAATDRVTTVDVMRESPATMLRAAGDIIAYTNAGAVVDKRGYVISPDVHAGTIAARMLGFYPASAAEQYQIIRVSKRITDYQRETTAGFRAAWIKAKLQGDEAQAQAVADSVRDWNEGARGTALEIKNFVPLSQRALREARRPAKERLLRGAPRAARADLEQIADLLGYND